MLKDLDTPEDSHLLLDIASSGNGSKGEALAKDALWKVLSFSFMEGHPDVRNSKGTQKGTHEEDGSDLKPPTKERIDTQGCRP